MVDDLFKAAPAAPTIPPILPVEGLGELDGLLEDEDEDDRDLPPLEEFEEEDLEPEPPFIFASRKNNTATITTAARVTNTMIAVNRRARGML